jgi:hypothetical protein
VQPVTQRPRRGLRPRFGLPSASLRALSPESLGRSNGPPASVPVTCLDRAIDDCWRDAGATEALELCVAVQVEPCVD